MMSRHVDTAKTGAEWQYLGGSLQKASTVRGLYIAGAGIPQE